MHFSASHASLQLIVVPPLQRSTALSVCANSVKGMRGRPRKSPPPSSAPVTSVEEAVYAGHVVAAVQRRLWLPSCTRASFRRAREDDDERYLRLLEAVIKNED